MKKHFYCSLDPMIFHADERKTVEKNYPRQQEKCRNSAKIMYSPLQKQTGFARKF
jgi:hypothetical protein